MRIPKRYGEYKVAKCPFCSADATSRNGQKIPVCSRHSGKSLGELKCLCGDSLTALNGKFGVFFNCPNCGNMSMKKALERAGFDSSK